MGSAFNFVMEKVQSKLSGWKTKLLPRVGKLMLAKITVTSIAKYYMQCHDLPIKVCDGIDKVVRDFMWGSTEGKKRMHMVN